ncbi:MULTISPECIES: hypothetical protein [Bacillaceae]|nr:MULTISPECIES: hypothetical protein [Bacillaceae]
MKRVYQISLGDPIGNSMIINGKWYKDARDALIARISLIAAYE